MPASIPELKSHLDQMKRAFRQALMQGAPDAPALALEVKKAALSYAKVFKNRDFTLPYVSQLGLDAKGMGISFELLKRHGLDPASLGLDLDTRTKSQSDNIKRDVLNHEKMKFAELSTKQRK